MESILKQIDVLIRETEKLEHLLQAETETKKVIIAKETTGRIITLLWDMKGISK